MGSSVEIRCHPNCPWAARWEIADVVATPSGPGYRVRRLGLVRPLEAVLPAEDVRAVRIRVLGRAG